VAGARRPVSRQLARDLPQRVPRRQPLRLRHDVRRHRPHRLWIEVQAGQGVGAAEGPRRVEQKAA
jgi:hypothetical protein